MQTGKVVSEEALQIAEKTGEKPRRKRKIYPCEYTVSNNSKEK